jgi:hypothetical protein
MSNNPRRYSFLAATVLVWLVIGISPESMRAEEKSLTDRFLSEAPQGWARLKAATEQLEGSGVWSTDTRTGGVAPRPSSYLWKFKGSPSRR